MSAIKLFVIRRIYSNSILTICRKIEVSLTTITKKYMSGFNLNRCYRQTFLLNLSNVNCSDINFIFIVYID